MIKRKGSRGLKEIFKIMGLLFIFAGIILNPIIVEKFFSIDQDISGPTSRTIVMLELFLIIIGLLLIKYNLTKKLIQKINPNIRLLFISILVCLLLFEISLRFFPQMLGEDFKTGVMSKYHTRTDGIYEYDPSLKMYFMKPNFTTINYASGYYWTHKTDSMGFRNPIDRKKVDIVLIGDSFIYGHGVEQNQTVGYFLEQLTDYSVANLARQGDYTFHEAYVLNVYGLKLKPSYILYFYLINDIADTYSFLNEDEMKEFIKIPLDQIEFHEREKLTKINSQLIAYKLWGNKRIFKPYILRVIDMVKFKIELKRNPKRLDYPEDSLGWNYTKKIILQMDYISRLNNVEFIIVPLTFNYTNQFDILRNLSIEHNLSFIDIRIFDFNNKSLFLERDTHFSETGARFIANMVSDYLSENKK